jgi:hypothetical protein
VGFAQVAVALIPISLSKIQIEMDDLIMLDSQTGAAMGIGWRLTMMT